MKLQRLYAILVAAFTCSCVILFWVSTILPSFVSVLDAGKFERSLVNHKFLIEADRKQRSSGESFGNTEIISGPKGNQKSPKILKLKSLSPSVLEEEDPKALSTTLGVSQFSSNKPNRHVTKSLAELGYVSGKVNPDFLFFNRVPKCGSEMLVLLLQWLQGQNGFKHVRLGGGNIRRLKRLQQEEVVEEVLRQEKEGLPLSFDRHVYWLNFSSFDHSTPVWINLIRDPVEKAASRFYYARQLHKDLYYDTNQQTFEECVQSGVDQNCIFETGRMYDLTIPYFCGHEKWCMVLNDQWALEEAKANVDRFYPVVGVLEEINATLAVLERKLPRFFSGVQEMYFTELLEPHHNKNRKRPREIREDIKYHLKSILKMEYEFYDFIRSRLFRQTVNSWVRETVSANILMPDSGIILRVSPYAMRTMPESGIETSAPAASLTRWRTQEDFISIKCQENARHFIVKCTALKSGLKTFAYKRLNKKSFPILL